MKHVIITGGTRGIGAGLTERFLESNCHVTFCGSNDNSVNRATNSLALKFNSNRFRGVVCNVTKHSEIETLWDFSTKIFGKADIFINNAGVSNIKKQFNELDPEEMERVVDINIKGIINATHLAYNKMLKQGEGAIYNMGGAGSDGRIVKGLAPYGMTKQAVSYFTKAISREASGGPVIFGLLLPGMVLTDMLLDPIRRDPLGTKRQARIYNLLAEEVTPVTQFLAEKILENEKNGVTISYQNSRKTVVRFISGVVTNRNIVSKYL